MNQAPEITVQLIHIHGGLKGRIQEFTDPVITIGRLPSYSLTFTADEPGVSREHARIEREGNRFKLVAVKDKFGTFVNGKQVREALLRNGDVIEFGSGGPKVSFHSEMASMMPSTETVRHEKVPSAAPAPTPSIPGKGEEPAAQVPLDPPVQRTKNPLVIQFGPTIRSYQELPVVIGSHAGCDFMLLQAGIYHRHAQIFFHQGDYFVKELTGVRLLRVNGREVEGSARLQQADELSFGPAGPLFRFLGGGRLAEVEAIQPDDSSRQTHDPREQAATNAPGKAPPDNFFSRLVKQFK